MTEPAGVLALLEMVDRGTERLSVGMDARLLRFRWAKSGGSDAALVEAIDAMVERGWLEVLTEAPMSLRLTVAGFEQALKQQGLKRHAEFEAPLDEDGGDGDGVLVGEDVPLSEIELREQLIAALAELDPDGGHRLAASSVLAVWLHAGRRADSMRQAVALAERDGHLSVERTPRGQMLILSPQGARFARGRPSPEALRRLAQPLDVEALRLKAPDDDSLLLIAAGELQRAGATPSFTLKDLEEALDEVPGPPRAAALRAADLLHRLGYAKLEDESAPVLRWSAAGRALCERATAPGARQPEVAAPGPDAERSGVEP